MSVTIIGAGIGGLSAALNLARKGIPVVVFEASETVGGLAKSVSVDNSFYDAGPYILLDKPGLDWAFSHLDLSIDALELKRITNVYSVESDTTFFSIKSDITTTVNELNARWSNQGNLYLNFVEETYKRYQQLFPFTFAKPNPWNIIKGGNWGLLPFLISTLGKVIDKYQLNEDIKNGIGIWTHVAAQSLYKAPSPMSFVPSLIHNIGAYYPSNGIGNIATTLYDACLKSGVQFRFNAKVERIAIQGDCVTGIHLSGGEYVETRKIISNSNAIGTYVNLIKETPDAYRNKITALPLQSPGLCVFLKVKGKPTGDYIKFRLDKNIPNCKSFILPDLIGNSHTDDWMKARLVFPLPYDYANKMSEEQCLELIQNVLNESWWKKGITDYKVVGYNTPATWSEKFNLYNKSMNPVMTSEFMRMGRIHYKSNYFKGLYFAGSSTHPGQWVSFCSISGILSSNELLKEL